MAVARIILDLLRVVGATGEGGLLSFPVLLQDEGVDGSKRAQLSLRGCVGASDVGDGSLIHSGLYRHPELLSARSRGGLFLRTRAPSLHAAGL
jgi:hypothetical protein